MAVAPAIADASSAALLAHQSAPTQSPSQNAPAPAAETPPSTSESTQASAPTQKAFSVRSRFDEKMNRAFFEVYDPSSDQVIVQFPPEKLVRYFRAMAARLGALVNQVA